MIGIATSDPTRVSAWATRVARGGIWGPAGISSDGRSLFVATGNTSAPAGTWQDSEAVVKLPPSLAASTQASDTFAPANWEELDRMDLDLGGTAPIVVDVPGATPSALVVALGKDRRAYVLDRNDLGGIGEPLAGALVSAEAIINASASFTTPTGTHVVFRGFGASCPILAGEGHLTVFRIAATAPPTIVPEWCGLPKSLTSQAVTMIDAAGTDALIWATGTDGKLYARDAEDGSAVFDGGGDAGVVLGVQKFQSPIFAHGRAFVVGDRAVAFKPTE